MILLQLLLHDPVDGEPEFAIDGIFIDPKSIFTDHPLIEMARLDIKGIQ